jgi:hypothetical protein
MADMALICKLRSFYPVPAYTYRQHWFHVAPLLVLIPPRLVAISFLPAAHILERRELAYRMNVTEYSLQILWCTFATGEDPQPISSIRDTDLSHPAAILFYKSWRFYQRAATRGDERLKRKLRILMESLLCTFMVPLIFQITCVILLAVYKDTSRPSFRAVNALNLFSSVHFALLSTTWSAIRHRSEKAAERAPPSPNLVTTFFASVSTSSLELQDHSKHQLQHCCSRC